MLIGAAAGAPRSHHTGTPIMAVTQTSDTAFEKDVLKATKPVLVDFWAEWCGPCKMIAPYLEDLAAEMGEQVEVIKVNIDENPLTPTRYGVRGIPTLMLFKNGEVAATKVGALPKSKLVEWVQQSI
jgi:thioredoxin 1